MGLAFLKTDFGSTNHLNFLSGDSQITVKNHGGQKINSEFFLIFLTKAKMDYLYNLLFQNLSLPPVTKFF